MRTTAIIAAGGIGARVGAVGGKQLLTIAGKPLAAWAIQACADARGVDEIVVACDPERVASYEEQLGAAIATLKPLSFIAGGAVRTASIAAALKLVPDDTDLILVQDGARPLLTPALVDAALDALVAADEQIAGMIVGHPVSDTLKAATEIPTDGLPRINATVPREGLWQVQTPQVFRAVALRDAYDRAMTSEQTATDDAGLIEDAGYQLALLTGPRDNVKVTVPEDIELVEALLRAGRSEEGTAQ